MKRLLWSVMLWSVGSTVAWAQMGQIPRGPRAQESQVGMLWVGKGKQRVPLKLQRLQIRTRIDGLLVHTEVTHVFQNHTNQVIEGTFAFRLPQGAVLQRLAMEIDGRMMEGEIVEKDRARHIYEKIVEEMRDPALLEMTRERLFQTRIYPIPARGQKRVLIAFQHLLRQHHGHGHYHYALPRVSDRTLTSGTADAHRARFSVAIGEVDWKIALRGTSAVAVTPYTMQRKAVGTGLLLQLQQKAFRPRGALRLQIPMRRDRSLLVHRQGRTGKLGPFVAMSLWPKVGDRHEDKGVRSGQQPQSKVGGASATGASGGASQADWIFVVDTSADMRRSDYALGVQTVYSLLGQLGPQERFHVLSGATQAKTFASQFSKPDKRIAAVEHLSRQTLEGAGDLVALFKAALGLVRKRRTYLVYIGDGRAASGILVPEQLVQTIHKMTASPKLQAFHAKPANPQLSFFGVALGRRVSHPFFRLLCRKSGSYVRLLGPLSVHRRLAHLARMMRGALLTHVEARVIGQDIPLFPKQLPAVALGEALTLFVKTDRPLRVQLQGRRNGHLHRWNYRVDPKQGRSNDTLHCYYGHQKLQAVQAAGEPRKQIVALSKRYGVMSRHTSLLVLENDKAYKKYHIKRRKQQEQARKERRLAMARGTRFADWLKSQGQGGRPAQSLPLSGGGTTSKTPQSYWSGGGSGGGGGGNGTSVSPDRVQPGDPVIQIRAPRDAASVYVILPHGEMKFARWTRVTRTWMVRFLVPPDLPDGVYHIQVVIVHRSGRVERRKTFYTVDTTAPGLTMRTIPAKPKAGQRVRILISQRMKKQEIMASLAALPFRKTRKIPDWGYDIQSVYALDQHKKLHRLKRVGPNRWELKTRIPQNGKVSLEFSATDSAGNVRVQRFQLR